MFKTYSIDDFIPQQQQNKKTTHFYIQQFEQFNFDKELLQPFKTNFYTLYLVKNGYTDYQIEQKTYTLRTNTLLLSAPNQLHHWKINKMTKGYILLFTDECFKIGQPDDHFLVDLDYLVNIQNQQIDLIIKFHQQIYTYFELLETEYNHKYKSEKALQSLLFLLLLEIKRYFPHAPKVQNQGSVYKQFKILLEQKYDQKWTASDYAKALHISPRHLNRIVQEKTNKNLTNAIQERTMLEAKRLLTFSEFTVRQVASQLGFEDSAYFARCFRKHINLSPTEFRKSAKGKL